MWIGVCDPFHMQEDTQFIQAQTNGLIGIIDVLAIQEVTDFFHHTAVFIDRTKHW